MSRLAQLVALLVLVAVLASCAPSRAPPDGLRPYLRLSVSAPPYKTFDSIELTIESELVELNATGNETYVPNYNVGNLTVHDETTDTIVYRDSFNLGVRVVYVPVKPEWTDTRLRILVVDYATGLSDSIEVRTEMSQTYFLWYLQQTTLIPVQETLRDVRAEAQGYQALTTALLLIVFVLVGVILILVFFKREHKISRDRGTISLWDRISARIFPWALRNDGLQEWLDPRISWDQETAREYVVRINEGPIAELKAHEAWVHKEIERLKRELPKILITEEELPPELQPVPKEDAA